MEYLCLMVVSVNCWWLTYYSHIVNNRNKKWVCWWLTYYSHIVNNRNKKMGFAGTDFIS